MRLSSPAQVSRAESNVVRDQAVIIGAMHGLTVQPSVQPSLPTTFLGKLHGPTPGCRSAALVDASRQGSRSLHSGMVNETPRDISRDQGRGRLLAKLLSLIGC